MDAETGLLPHEFTYWGIAVGFVLSVFYPLDTSGTVFLVNLFALRIGLLAAHAVSSLDAILAIMFGAGFFYLAWALYFLIRKREGIGIGDIAFAAMIGVFLGLKLTVLVVFLAPVVATLFALGARLFQIDAMREQPSGQPGNSREPVGFLSQELPFGVFLGVCALIALFFGRLIWSSYLGLFR